MAQIFPALKPGVIFFIEHDLNGSFVQVGVGEFGVRLNGHTAISIISKCNGEYAISDIAHEIRVTEKDILNIIQPLITNRLINLLSHPKNSFTFPRDDLSIQMLQEQMESELNLISWRGSRNPILDLYKRQKYKIQLIGNNKIAYSIYLLLISTGYINLKLNFDYSEQVKAKHLGGSPFSKRDIGNSIKELLAYQVRDFGLNLSLLDGSKLNQTQDLELTSWQPDLVISTRNLLPDSWQQFMSESVKHLQISNFSRGQIEIGPLVVPGQTPCFNCIELWKLEANRKLATSIIASKSAEPLELSASATSFISGLVIGLIDNYFSQGTSFLIGSSILINLVKPFEYVERFWQPNPSCGCLELL